MTIHEALQQALTDAAAALAVPLFWTGETYIAPAVPYVVARILTDQTGAAGLGSAGLTRTDGALVAECTTMSGWGDNAATELARRLSRQFPRGRSLDVGKGELVFHTPVSGPADTTGTRLTVPLKLPFYAITEATV